MPPSAVHAFEKSALPVTRGSLAAFTRDVYSGLRGLHAEHGPIAALDDGPQRIVFLFDPAYNKQVLSDASTYHARFFGIRGPKRSSQRRLTCGLLAMNGEQHRRNRRMLKEPFGLRTIAEYRPAIAQFATETAATWAPGQQFDLNEEMTRFMLRVTSSLLFGLDEPDWAYDIGEQIFAWVTMNHELGVGALVPNAEFSARYEDLLAFAGGLESQVMEMIHRRRSDPKPGKDVLSILVRSQDEVGGLSDEELVGQACVLFAAAHMTTAHSFTWAQFLLAQHPSVLRRLHEELDQADAEPAGASVLGAAKGGASLLERVIKESMRVLPASAYSQRINNEAVRLGPFDLHRGTPIVFTPLITHHLPHIFPDPERFDPDRWLTIKPSGYEYHPFGGGPRLCIGGPLALEVLRTSLPIFLRRVRMSVVPGSDVTAEVHSTMLNPAKGVTVRLFEQDGKFEASPVTGNIHDLVNSFEL